MGATVRRGLTHLLGLTRERSSKIGSWESQHNAPGKRDLHGGPAAVGPVDPPLLAPTAFPEELDADAWQKGRGNFYKLATQKTGLSGKLRAVKRTFDHAQPSDKLLAEVPIDPGRLDQFRQVIEDQHDPFFEATAHALQHIEDEQKAIKASKMIPSSERTRLDDMARRLRTLQNVVKENLDTLPEGLRDLCRAKLQKDPVIQTAHALQLSVPQGIGKLIRNIPETKSLSDFTNTFGNDNPGRHIIAAEKLWNEQLYKLVPSVIEKVPWTGFPQIIMDLGRGRLYNSIKDEIETHNNEIDSATAASIATIESMRAQRNEEIDDTISTEEADIKRMLEERYAKISELEENALANISINEHWAGLDAAIGKAKEREDQYENAMEVANKEVRRIRSSLAADQPVPQKYSDYLKSTNHELALARNEVQRLTEQSVKARADVKERAGRMRAKFADWADKTRAGVKARADAKRASSEASAKTQRVYIKDAAQEQRAEVAEAVIQKRLAELTNPLEESAQIVDGAYSRLFRQLNELVGL
jgi:hypothetical protein